MMNERISATEPPRLGAAKPLNILFMTAWYPSEQQPGAGIFVREHAKAVGLRHRVMILHLAGWDRHLPAKWSVERIEQPAVSEGIPTYRVRYRLSPIPGAGSGLRYWSTWRAYDYLVAHGFRPDLIHAHVHASALPAALLGKAHGIPVVVTEHSTAFPRKLLGRRHIWEARLSFRLACRVLPVSRSLQRSIEEYGIHARFQIVPNAVDTRLFQPGPGGRTGAGPLKLLFVGSLADAHRKGMPYLLDALLMLREQRNDWQLDVVGDGPLRTVYEQHVRQLHLADKVTFHGRQAKPAVAWFMQQADLFVLPSLWENLPCVILEAMATGLPIVATRTGGVPEVVDERTGVLVEPGDARRLAGALAHMLAARHSFDRSYIVQRAKGTVMSQSAPPFTAFTRIASHDS